MRQALRRLASNATYGVKTRVARHPSIAEPLERLRGHGALIDDRTDIVIEGFPRCASSFVVAAFRLAQEPREMHIVDHTHEPAQVIRGVRRGIPTLVLIRPAKGAVVSLLIRKPLLSVGTVLRGYLRFYEPLVPLHDGFVTATFDEVLRDLGGSIDRINQRFGTSFAPFLHTPEHLARIDHEIEDDYRSRVVAGEIFERIVPRPSALREQLKGEVERRFDELAPEEDLRRAAAVYARLTEDH